MVRIPSDPSPENLRKGFVKLVGVSRKKPPLTFLIRPSDTVGIKVNCLGGKGLSPRPELVESLVELVRDAGVPEHKIIVFDRSDRELHRAGFPLNRRGKGYRVFGINQDYDSEISESGPVGSCYATLVSKTVTRLISVGVLKDHDLAGISVGMKNFYGVIHNPNKYHMNNCSPYVAHVVSHPFIRDKLALTVIDAHRAQYHGGPAYSSRYIWDERAVYLSLDPVAVDAVAWSVIEKKRKEKKMKSLQEEERVPAYISAAAALGLGISEMKKIQIVQI